MLEDLLLEELLGGITTQPPHADLDRVDMKLVAQQGGDLPLGDGVAATVIAPRRSRILRQPKSNAS